MHTQKSKGAWAPAVFYPKVPLSKTLFHLLDLKAAFDTVEQAITATSWALCGHLWKCPQLVYIFLDGQALSVGIGSSVSSTGSLSSGVPQGSVLCPTMFSLYILPLGSSFRRHRVSFHLYEINLKDLDILHACLNDLRSWNWSYCVWTLCGEKKSISNLGDLFIY